MPARSAHAGSWEQQDEKETYQNYLADFSQVGIYLSDFFFLKKIHGSDRQRADGIARRLLYTW